MDSKAPSKTMRKKKQNTFFQPHSLNSTWRFRRRRRLTDTGPFYSKFQYDSIYQFKIFANIDRSILVNIAEKIYSLLRFPM